MTGGQAVDMSTSTTFELPGYTVERTLGLSWGLIVRSVGLTKGLTGTVRSLKAGEVKEFTEVVDRARHTAWSASSTTPGSSAAMPSSGCGSTPRTWATAWPRSSPTAPPPPSGQPDQGAGRRPPLRPLPGHPCRRCARVASSTLGSGGHLAPCLKVGGRWNSSKSSLQEAVSLPVQSRCCPVAARRPTARRRKGEGGS
jgi:Putative heavy-metal-binding